jgi:hypothetical protein
MVLHLNDVKLQQKVCQVLNNLICDDNVDTMQAANVPELMNTAALSFPSECHKEACILRECLGYDSTCNFHNSEKATF